jgi:hypothetical protein
LPKERIAVELVRRLVAEPSQHVVAEVERLHATRALVRVELAVTIARARALLGERFDEEHQRVGIGDVLGIATTFSGRGVRVKPAAEF